MFSDTELMERYAGGDGNAFTEFYNRHHEEVCRYVRSIYRLSPEDLEEIVNDAFYKTAVRNPKEPAGFVRRLAAKIASRFIYHQINDKATATREPMPKSVFAEDTGFDVIVKDAIQQLAPRDAELVRGMIANEPYKESAANIGVSESSHIYKARLAAAKRLQWKLA